MKKLNLLKTRLKFFITSAIFFFSILKLGAQNLTAQQFVEDLEFLKKELPKRHKNLFAKISEEEFNQKIEQIAQKSKTLNNEIFEIELYKLIKEIGDEHTRIEPIYKTKFPINFDFFKEGIYVTKTDSLHSNLLYKKLNGVENKTTNDIIKDFRKIIKSDNQSYFEIYFQNFINNPRVLNGLKIIDSLTNANFILNQQKYLISSVQKHNFHEPFSKLLRYRNNDKYWYEIIDDGNIIYFNYQDCSEQDNKPFTVFNDELFRDIDKHQPEKIILDLRNNSGGNSAILKPFLDKLSENHVNKKGSLYVLLGKKTFSSALMNAVDLKRNFNSILVGEPTSGNVNHYGETRGFRLPNSKITVGYSTKYWENWKGYSGPLLPDIKIKYSIKNFKKNIDEAIEYVKDAR